MLEYRKAVVGSMLIICILSTMIYAQEFTIENLPPVVVKTLPQSGDMRVDAHLSEIKVSFSKEMLSGNYSFVRVSEDSFPTLVGPPGFLSDKRTCIVKVRLEPNKTYVLWLNSEQYKNFKDTKRQPAVPYLLVFKTGDR